MQSLLSIPPVADPETAADASAYLAAIVASSDDAIISKNLNGIITSWNAAAERVFGYTAAEAIGNHIGLIIPPDHIQEEFTIISRLRRGERIEHYETVRRAKSGKLLNISLTVSPIHDRNGTIVGASKVARDITERVMMERLLKEADQRKDEFIAMLAHELRNPLAPISNALHLLELPGIDTGKRRETSELVRRQITQMTRLLDDLLDVSRVTRGMMILRHDVVAIADVLQAALETTRPLFDAKGQTLSLDIPAPAMQMDGDSIRLAQVFTNLLNNASKYTQEGGHIAVRAWSEDGQAVVSVTDNGLGISGEQLGSVFDLFMQADRSIERAQSGLGIGLTLVQKIVELHGGKVTVASEGIGKGSCFTLRLPLLAKAVAKKPKEARAAEPKEQNGKGRSILVVDDNAASAKTLGWALEMLGHRVHISTTPEDALEAAHALSPDVILLDIGLPRLSGYDLCKQLRQHPALKNTIFIAQTGWGREEHLRRSKEAGFHHHLVKPIDLNTVQKILENNPLKL